MSSYHSQACACVASLSDYAARQSNELNTPCAKGHVKVSQTGRRLNKEGRSSQMGSWVPFSAGPHMCIGYSFALQEMKVKPVLRPAATCLPACCITCHLPWSQRSHRPLRYHSTAQRLTQGPRLSLQGLPPWPASRALVVISCCIASSSA